MLCDTPIPSANANVRSFKEQPLHVGTWVLTPVSAHTLLADPTMTTPRCKGAPANGCTPTPADEHTFTAE